MLGYDLHNFLTIYKLNDQSNYKKIYIDRLITNVNNHLFCNIRIYCAVNNGMRLLTFSQSIGSFEMNCTSSSSGSRGEVTKGCSQGGQFPAAFVFFICVIYTSQRNIYILLNLSLILKKMLSETNLFSLYSVSNSCQPNYVFMV